MKVTGVTTKKSVSDGTGIYRVTVEYVIGTRGKNVHTASLVYDWFGDTVRFADQNEYAMNMRAEDSLYEFVKAYFTLRFYGWEG